MDTSSTTQMAKILDKQRRSSRSSRTKQVWTSMRLGVGHVEVFMRTWMGESTELGSVCSLGRIILTGIRG